jgi:hypothetical protein
MKNVCTETDGVHHAECEVLTGVDKVSRHRIEIAADVSEETAAIFRFSDTLQKAAMTQFINRQGIK